MLKAKKAKCKHCKKRGDVADMVTTPAYLGHFCDYECAAAFGKANIEKGRKVERQEYNKETKRLKKQFGLDKEGKSARSRQQAATTKACNRYIRERDKNEACICCGLPLGDDYHAGHFKRANSFAIIEFDEDNIHAQRVDCNTRYGGDRGHYEYNLRKKIGDKRVDALYEKITGNNRVYKRTLDELKEIQKHYQKKYDELQTNTNETI